MFADVSASSDVILILGSIGILVVAAVAVYAIKRSGKFRLNVRRGDTQIEVEAGRGAVSSEGAKSRDSEGSQQPSSSDIKNVRVLDGANIQSGNVSIQVGHRHGGDHAKTDDE